jgi:hypothetical protein
MTDPLTVPMTRTEFNVLRQVRSGYSRDVISPAVREKLKSMGLIAETQRGLVVTNEGLRRIEAGKGKSRLDDRKGRAGIGLRQTAKCAAVRN